MEIYFDVNWRKSCVVVSAQLACALYSKRIAYYYEPIIDII